MAQKNPLLNLSTSVDVARDFILIDDNKCYMRSKQELNIKDYVNLRKMGKRIAQLYRASEISDEDLEEFTETMEQLMKFVFVGAPQETLDKLTDTQQMEIIGAFTKLLTAGLPEGAIKEAEKELLEQMEAENKKKSENKKTKKNMDS